MHLPDTVILDHFKDGSLKNLVSKNLSNHYGCLLLKFREKKDAEEFIQRTENVTIAGKRPLVIHPRLLISSPVPEKSDVADANRFADNEELLFSLRSLQKNAPWVRICKQWSSFAVSPLPFLSPSLLSLLLPPLPPASSSSCFLLLLLRNT